MSRGHVKPLEAGLYQVLWTRGFTKSLVVPHTHGALGLENMTWQRWVFCADLDISRTSQQKYQGGFAKPLNKRNFMKDLPIYVWKDWNGHMSVCICVWSPYGILQNPFYVGGLQSPQGLCKAPLQRWLSEILEDLWVGKKTEMCICVYVCMCKPLKRKCFAESLYTRSFTKLLPVQGLRIHIYMHISVFFTSAVT